MILVRQLTPVIPVPLLPTAAMVPATWVPCSSPPGDRVGVVDARVVVGEVEPMEVVKVAVLVVVDAVAGDLARVRSDITPQVRMVYIHALVYDRNDHASAPHRGVPASAASMSASAVPPVWPVLFKA